MASKAALSRLRRELIKINQTPIPGILTTPLETNILEWHFVIDGPEETLLEGGQFHGKLVFPHDYPYKPPAIYMFTPSGTFIFPFIYTCASVYAILSHYNHDLIEYIYHLYRLSRH